MTGLWSGAGQIDNKKRTLEVILPLVDPFIQPYEAWTTRTPSIEEMMEAQKRTGKVSLHMNDQLIARVTTGLEAANYIGSVGADNGLGNHINDALDNDSSYVVWRREMPSATPPGLKNYKSRYPAYDAVQVNSEINVHGAFLSPGQVLFHAGVWPGGLSLVTDRPLSSSFCPQVALRNAEHRGKAYDANRIDLFVLRVAASATKAFAYKRKGLALGHENEVLFSAGASLSLISQTLIRHGHPVGKAHCAEKRVPLYVLEIELS